MKIPFDIKFRPQIESGEYKVETRDGRAVRIVCWDAKGLCPIIYLLNPIGFGGDSIENPHHCNSDGRYCNRAACQDEDLFIITPEPELSEMEVHLLSWLSDDTKGEIHMDRMKELVRNRAAELLDLARKEIKRQGNIVLSIEDFEKHYVEAQEKGRKEALKDMPRWKRSNRIEQFNERMISLAGGNDLLCTNYAEEGEYYIPFSDLEKLPKED